MGTTIVLSSQYYPNSYANSYIMEFISFLCALNQVGKGEKTLHFVMQDNQKSSRENGSDIGVSVFLQYPPAHIFAL